MFTQDDRKEIEQELSKMPDSAFWVVMRNFEELFGHVPVIIQDIRQMWLAESKKRMEVIGLK